ncbi:MAG: hypothetical protein WCS30_14350 [Selenomonadaceae bacterium]
MNENKVTIDMENLTEDERKQLMALCEKANKKEEWPKIGDEYWCVKGCGIVRNVAWEGNFLDMGCKAIGNMFKTEKEAKFHAEYLKVCAELERLSDWEEGTIYCIIYYQRGIVIDDDEDLISGPYNFKSEESAQNAIDTIGEDRLKKYYFGVKE